MQTGSIQVIDCDAGRAWTFTDAQGAIRHANAVHAPSGNVVEVVRDGVQILVLPPDAPLARPSQLTPARDSSRYQGDDIVIARADSSEVIYCGREGRADAVREGVLVTSP